MSVSEMESGGIRCLRSPSKLCYEIHQDANQQYLPFQIEVQLSTERVTTFDLNTFAASVLIL